MFGVHFSRFSIFCLLFCLLSSQFDFGMASFPISQKVDLPEKLIVGYANWNECDEKIVEAVKNGVNVVMWFSINLAVNQDTGKPEITNGPDMTCVAERVKQIRELNLPTIHIISIGGWNSPHPDTSITAEETYENWNHWNRHIAARPELGFMGFDGFDWDIEGTVLPLINVVASRNEFFAT
jgi:hypothetical protein